MNMKKSKEGKRQKIIAWLNSRRKREIIIYDGLARNSYSKGKGNQEECKIERFDRREKRYEIIIIYSPPYSMPNMKQSCTRYLKS